MVATPWVPAQTWMPPLGQRLQQAAGLGDDVFNRRIIGQHGKNAIAVASRPLAIEPSTVAPSVGQRLGLIGRPVIDADVMPAFEQCGAP